MTIYKNLPPIRFKYRKDLPIYLRDSHGINALHRVQINLIKEQIELLHLAGRKLRTFDPRIARLRDYRRRLVHLLMVVLKADAPPQKQIRDRVRASISRFEEEGFKFSANFRFPADQLRNLLECFHFPSEPIIIKGSKFTSEEILMVSLKRLAYPNRWMDLEKVFNRSSTELSNAFYWFLDFIIVNWSYLILNNREYWLDKLAISAEAIRVKLANLSRVENRQFYEAAYTPNDFCVALFIDNTLWAMNRPGSGAENDGEAAERKTKLLQQAFLTGWKTFHGLKWQTVWILKFGVLHLQDGMITSRCIGRILNKNWNCCS